MKSTRQAKGVISELILQVRWIISCVLTWRFGNPWESSPPKHYNSLGHRELSYEEYQDFIQQVQKTTPRRGWSTHTDESQKNTPANGKSDLP